MHPSHAVRTILIEPTRTVWQPRLWRTLADEDARPIAEHVTGFFAILAEGSRAAKDVPAIDSTVTARPDTAEVCHDR